MDHLTFLQPDADRSICWDRSGLIVAGDREDHTDRAVCQHDLRADREFVWIHAETRFRLMSASHGACFRLLEAQRVSCLGPPAGSYRR